MGNRGPKNGPFIKVLSEEDKEWLAEIINERGSFAAQTNTFISNRIVYRTTFPIYKLKSSQNEDDFHDISEICEQDITIVKNKYLKKDDMDITLTSHKLKSIMEMIWNYLDEDRQDDYMAVLSKCVEKERLCECESHIIL